MSNLTKLKINALDITGNNYITWAVRGNGLLDTIDCSKTVSDDKKAKAMIFLRHHIHDGLKDEYITKEDPKNLWQSLKERFDHQKYVILPKAKHEWIHLRFQDYKSQQYRVSGYTRYSELMQVLLVAEQNNQLVTLNHHARPTGAAPFPEANVASSSYDNLRGRGSRCGHYHGRGRGRGRRFRPYDERNKKYFHENERGRDDKRQTKKVCYRCGMKGHCVHSCRTPKHLANLYRESQKVKEKGGETNFISYELGPSFHSLNDDTHLDVSDFLVELENINV
ncbi:hypothetical protein N665_0426s0011 [Sinapis alba]|nr:hypothetical protein N665_0426s0011 [Sinapis alba]